MWAVILHWAPCNRGCSAPSAWLGYGTSRNLMPVFYWHLIAVSLWSRCKWQQHAQLRLLLSGAAKGPWTVSSTLICVILGEQKEVLYQQERAWSTETSRMLWHTEPAFPRGAAKMATARPLRWKCLTAIKLLTVILRLKSRKYFILSAILALL